MKQGQIQQVFIYIMALIVIAFMVVMAFRLIPGILDRSCSVEDTQFIVNIERSIDSGSRSGRVSNPQMKSPCDYSILCFVNHSSIGDPNFELELEDLSERLQDRYQIIESSIRDDIPYNVFLIDESAQGTTHPVFYDERISTKQETITCVEASNGYFSYWVKGLGSEGILVYAEP